MRQKGSAGPGSGLPWAAEGGAEPDVGKLVQSLDAATLNMGLLSLEAVCDAANQNSPLGAAESACTLASRLAEQMSELEAAIMDVMRGFDR